jgi:hypothetical protein
LQKHKKGKGDMRAWLIPIYAVVGFVLILLAAPTTRWVVLKQLDVMGGKWRYHSTLVKEGYESAIEMHPVYPDLDGTEPPPNETARFLNLMRFVGAPWLNPNQVRQLRDLYDLCRSKNDLNYLAQFVQLAADQGRVNWPQLKPSPGKQTPPKRAPDHVYDTPEIQTRLRDACLQGEKLDPNNAFFPAILAGVLNRMGDLQGSRAAFLRAASDPNYFEYGSFEPDMRWAYIVAHYGNRGNQPKAQLYLSRFWMAEPCIQGIGRYFCDEKDFQGRLAAMKLGTLMVNKGKSDLGLYVGKDLIEWAVKSWTSDYRRGDRLDADLFNRFKKQMASVPNVKGVIDPAEKAAEEAYASGQPYAHLFDGIPEHQNLIENFTPALSAWPLWALVMIPLGLAVLSQKIRVPEVSAASPYLVWLTVFPICSFYEHYGTWPQFFNFAALLFVPAMFPKARRYTDLCGIILIGAAFLCSLPLRCPPLAVPLALFAYGLIIDRRFTSIPFWVSAIGLAGGCAIGAGCWVAMTARDGVWAGIIFGLQATIVACAAVPVRAPVRWLPLAGAACLILGVWFGVRVSRDLSEDRQLALVCDILQHEGEKLRGER